MFSSHFRSQEKITLRNVDDSTGCHPACWEEAVLCPFLKSTTIPTSFTALSDRLLLLHQCCSRWTAFPSAGSSPLEMELVFRDGWQDGVEGQAAVYKLDPYIVACGVQMFHDIVPNHIHCVLIGSVGPESKLLWVQFWISKLYEPGTGAPRPS